jgi:peptidoglycan/xylan/chitin deacetylase (PgdA/CDA1 family)
MLPSHIDYENLAGAANPGELIKRILKLFVSLVVCSCGSLVRTLRAWFGHSASRDFVVLYYHLVEMKDRDRFCWQMDYLSKHAQAVPADYKGPFPAGRTPVAVTFDDAFASLADTAIPEMALRGIPFTVFVPTAFIGRPAGWIRYAGNRLPLPQVMDSSQLQALGRIPDAGIGSHCRSHRRLIELQDPESKEEIKRSKEELEEILGRGVNLLSFPHGSYRENHLVMAREAGYERVFTIEPGRNRESTEFMFSAGRIRVDPGDWKTEFRLKVSGSYSWMTIASRIMKRISLRDGCQR